MKILPHVWITSLFGEAGLQDNKAKSYYTVVYTLLMWIDRRACQYFKAASQQEWA